MPNRKYTVELKSEAIKQAAAPMSLKELLVEVSRCLKTGGRLDLDKEFWQSMDKYRI